MFNRLIYLGYYFYKLDWRHYTKFARYVRKEYQKNSISIFLDSIYNSLKYNISLLEYFYFHFYRLKPETKRTYAGTGYMYEYQRLMNPKKYRKVLEDKREFLEVFKNFVKHDHADYDSFTNNRARAMELLDNPSGKIVLKKHDGQCGIGVEVLSATGESYLQVVERLKKSNNDLVEEFIVQHPDLMDLSPSGLNTIRIYTQLDKQDKATILGCRIRISVNSVVDNLAAGNLAAPIEESDGMVSGPAIYSDITKEDVEFHPVTGKQITGFRIPFWKETLELAKTAARHYPFCRSVGWDIAITSKGPELIEGNHDWCKLVWQLPVKQGLKEILKKHKQEYLNMDKKRKSE